MRMYYSIGVFSVCFNFIYGQTLPLKQSFEEEPSDNWNFTTNPAAFNDGGDVWDRVSDTGQYFSPAPDGTNFWEFYDIDAIPGILDDKVCHLIFGTIELSTQEVCTLSFDYCNRGLDSADYMSYTVVFDNSNNWNSADEVILPKHEESLCTWHTVYIPVSADAQYCRLRLSAKANYSADCGGFDRIEFKTGATIVPGITIVTPADRSYYENCISNIAVSGTATNIEGTITWSNSLNNATGQIAATGIWSIASITLGDGENKISVTATNESGMSAVHKVTLLRGLSFFPSGPGSIAFTAFNSEGDSFAFAALKNLAAGTTIRFCDEEWNGVKFTSETGEDDLVWSNETETDAGTVVEFYKCDSTATISNNIGVIVSGCLSLSQSGEGIMAYYGSEQREPSTFLAAISSNSGNITGTGLIYGETAVDIPQTTLSQYYSGTRSGEQEWSNYLPLINAAANWAGTEGATESWGSCAAFTCKKAETVMLVE